MLGDVRKPLRTDEEGRRLDERREAPDRAFGDGRDRRLRGKSVERGPETVRQSAGRAEPVREFRELSHHGPDVFEERLALGSQRDRRRQRLTHPASRRMAPSSSSRRIRWRSDSAAAMRRSRDASRSATCAGSPRGAGHCPAQARRRRQRHRPGPDRWAIARPARAPRPRSPGQAEGDGDAARAQGRELDRSAVIVDVRAAFVERIPDDQGRIVQCSRETVPQRGPLSAIPEVDHEAGQCIARPSTPAQIDGEHQPCPG